MESLAECLCEAVGSDLCFCGLIPGEGVIETYSTGCDDVCGMAYVRLASATPGNSLSSVANVAQQPGNCQQGLLVPLEIGVFRCFPPPDQDGNPPDAATMLAITEQQIDDMMAMRRAVACCADSRDIVLGTYSPIGPEGLSIGGFWTLTLMVV
jgi:hypothetical protein